MTKQDQISIEIRAAGHEDADALRRIAQRDTRPLPDGELLIALADGQARAAISLASGEVVADPFHRTAELVELLAMRRSEMVVGNPRTSARRSRGGVLGRLAAEAADRVSA